MIGDAFVIDAVVHGYDYSDENMRPDAGTVGSLMATFTYNGFHRAWSPRNEPKWILDEYRFRHATDPDLLGKALFAESWTDVAIYHEVPIWGMFFNGPSPLSVGRAMRERWPGRVLLYGATSPWEPDPLGRIERLVEEDGIVGLKLYPMDIIAGEERAYRMDDPTIAFPIYEKARELGIKSVAIHKAIPLGPVLIPPFRPDDIEQAALAFPDLNFEIVHGGFAFLEETAFQLARFMNVSINLEGTSGFLCNAPRKFAEILGTFLAAGGGADRIIWSSGTMNLHPQPFLEAFWNFQIPEDMVEGYGIPQLTQEMKRQILGGNIARILGLDIEDLKRQFAGDEFSGKRELAEPWTGTAVPA